MKLLFVRIELARDRCLKGCLLVVLESKFNKNIRVWTLEEEVWLIIVCERLSRNDVATQTGYWDKQ